MLGGLFMGYSEFIFFWGVLFILLSVFIAIYKTIKETEHIQEGVIKNEETF